MDKREQKLILLVFIIVFVIALVADFMGGNLKCESVLERSTLGEEEKEVILELEAEDIIEDYVYKVIVEPERVTRKQAEQYFKEVKKQIDTECQDIENQIAIKDTYVNGIVEAEWSFSPIGLVTSEGKIVQEEISDKGSIVTVSVTLSCGAYEEIYCFPIFLEKRALTEEEKLVEKVDAWISSQMQQEGETQVLLPEEIDGIKIAWKEKREYISIQVLGLEIIAVVLIYILRQQEKKDAKNKRKREMEYVYSDIVNQMSVLIGAGMTTRQAWQRIANQYAKKRKQNYVEEQPVYEAILHMSYRLNEGESERSVYERFIEEIDVSCYRRLMRALVGNLEKGVSGICRYLEEEEKRAYDERLLLAKKRGEEASTKMLVPLMIMMVLVMVVVMTPAMIGFFN